MIKLQIIGDWPSGLVDHDSFVEGVGGQIFLFDHQIGINHHFMDLQGPKELSLPMLCLISSVCSCLWTVMSYERFVFSFRSFATSSALWIANTSLLPWRSRATASNWVLVLPPTPSQSQKNLVSIVVD